MVRENRKVYKYVHIGEIGGASEEKKKNDRQEKSSCSWPGVVI